MSDFTSGFWNLYVIVLVVASIIGCAWLLVRHRPHQGRRRDGTKDAKGKPVVEVTGHVWDGDLQEYNNPLPEVVGESVLDHDGVRGRLPGPVPGTRQHSRPSGLDVDRRVRDGAHRLRRSPQAALREVREDGRRAASPRIALRGRPASACSSRYCAQCHGSDAGGSRGFPNLRDGDWLYGGAPATIVETITGGRMGVMPAFGPVLGEDGVRNAAAYVRSLSGLAARQPARATGQAAVRAELRGLPWRGRQGQPGDGRAQPDRRHLAVRQFRKRRSAEGITNGRNANFAGGTTPMPSFKDTLTAGADSSGRRVCVGTVATRPAARSDLGGAHAGCRGGAGRRRL